MESDSDDDSDQPVWAGKYGDRTKTPGGGNHGKDTQKGTDYGDLFVMLRDDYGSLVYVDEDGNVCQGEGSCFPVAIILDEAGTIVGYFILLDDVDPPDTVTEVDFGRLNISRAPSKVLEHSLDEALSKLNGIVITEENLDELTDYSGRLLVAADVAIDSPLENLALYQAVLDAYDGKFEKPEDKLYSAEWFTEDEVSYLKITVGDLTLTMEEAVIPQLAASMLAAASDKTGTLSVDEVAYISKFLDVDDELATMVEDYSDWYHPEEFYDVSFNVVVINETSGQPEIQEVNLLTNVAFNTISPIDELEAFDNIFKPEDYYPGDMLTGIDIFTQAADDSVQVLEFVHDSFLP